MLGNAIGFHAPPFLYFGLRTPQHSQGSFRSHNNKERDSAIEKTEAAIAMAERKQLGAQAALFSKKDYTNVATIEISDLLAVGRSVGEWKTMKGQSVLGLEYEKMPRAK